jgi:hypothetical protein
LWALNDADVFSIAWRKALRRLVGLPHLTYSYLLPIISDSLPILMSFVNALLGLFCYVSYLFSLASCSVALLAQCQLSQSMILFQALMLCFVVNDSSARIVILYCSVWHNMVIVFSIVIIKMVRLKPNSAPLYCY